MVTTLRRVVFAALHAVVTAFCWLTAVYAFVASSAFAYQQFIKPRVFAWVGAFSDWHASLFPLWCLAFLMVVARDLRRRGVSRGVAAALTFGAIALGVWNGQHPVLPTLVDGTRSLLVGMAALLPVLGIAVLDHVAAARLLHTSEEPSTEAARRGVEGRWLVAGVGATLFVAVIYAASASASISRSFEPDLAGPGLAFTVLAAVADQAVMFLGFVLVVAAIGRLGRRSFLRHYVLLLLLLGGVCTWVIGTALGKSIGVTGPLAWAAAGVAGAAVAASWAGFALRRRLFSGDRLNTALDVFVGPSSATPRDARALWRLALTLPLAYGLFAVATRMDWDFILLNTGVLIVWVWTFVAVARVTPPAPQLGNAAWAAVCALPLMVHGFVDRSETRHHALERYAVHNPSFRLAEALVRVRPQAPSFERYLRANTGLTDVRPAPVSIDFVQPLTPTNGPKPLIFLFVIDSLRSDYLSPYNSAVRFTPRIQQFADENLLFANAFTRYGGTGLSMPAIWAGSALPHKQYVTPFAPMNAMEKLLAANDYHRIYSRDHITEALWDGSQPVSELDRGRKEMDFDFCRTLDELKGELRAGVAGSGPVFAQTRSLNLHVAAVRNGFVPSGKSYPGFEPPYAWRVERMDACFGGFVDELQALGLYERSLIVFTADHGELIGEDGRWGHSYHMFPEVIQIPLIMHVPSWVHVDRADRFGVSLSTDITPTIYDVLGYTPVAANDLMGHSLLSATDQSVAACRRDSFVLAASYGAVYAVIDRHGRELFIADAIQGGDRAYRRNSLGRWTEVDVDTGTRTMGQLRIRRFVDELARLYRTERRF